MDKADLVDLLCKLNEGFKDCSFVNERFEAIWENLKEQCVFDNEIYPSKLNRAGNITPVSSITREWNYITTSLNILHKLTDILERSDEMLSVQQTKNIKNSLKNLINIGISTKLLPNLPLYIKPECTYDDGDIFYNYNILKFTTSALCDLLKYPTVRIIILPDFLRPILVACYQIAYCPLKKPSTNSEKDQKNPITNEVYENLTLEKEKFVNILNYLHKSVHPGIYVKETMAILYGNTPPWFKKSVSQKLTTVLKSKNGVEHISTALLDGCSNDNTETWKILDVISKLIISCRTLPQFKENICNQLVTLLSRVTDETLIYERIYVHCTKNLYKVEPELAKGVLIRPVISFLLYFTYKSHHFEENENVNGKLKQSVRILHALFSETHDELKLPIDMLAPLVDVLFRFYALILNTNFKTTNNELKGLLIEYLMKNSGNIFDIFDSFLFSIGSDKILPIRNDILITISDKNINLNRPGHHITYSITESSEALTELLQSKTDLRLKLFRYLLNCLVNKKKYFQKASEELLSLEDKFMNEHLERSLVVYKLLAELAEDGDIQKAITADPGDIINYIENVLKKCTGYEHDKVVERDSEEFNSLFTVLMILQNLVSNCSNTENYNVIIGPLQQISVESKDDETKNIIGEILKVLKTGGEKPTRLFVEETELDKALDAIYDPSIPFRGHGLMTLAKLVEKKETNVLGRKQYVLNVFQQHLKEEDSYIYLNAIRGLTALADIFPDTVLNILCEEYSDGTKKQNDEGHEVRMKLGESLVRVTKILGDMAPKYKPLLLNTFLNGARDEDDLIRASSLSNLGEICRVLGYKLGTIVTEVMVCVHSIIATDKSPQARRAAVTVLRQLFAGLESEMIVFLKDDILPIYRTLKDIYYNDKDDVMRLQAQLALEELNENMKDFMLPKPQLDTKKIIVLN